MRVRQSVREKNNGRVCRHSRARVGSFDWDKKRLSFVSRAPQNSFFFVCWHKKRDEFNQRKKKKEEKKAKATGTTHSAMASTNSRCSSSVQLSLVFVIVYSFRAFTSTTRGGASSPFLCSSSSSFIFFFFFFIQSPTGNSSFRNEWISRDMFVWGVGSLRDPLALFSQTPLLRADKQKRTPPPRLLEKREIRRPDPPPKCVRSALVFLSPWEDDFFARVLPSVLLLHKNSSSFFCCYFRRKERSDNKNCVIVERTKKNEYWV